MKTTDTVQDSYPLSSLQEGMLFHSLYAPASGVNIEQLVCSLHEELNLPAFEQAWQYLMERHAVLRTAFYWEDLPKPIQQVHQRVELRPELQDWRQWSAQEQGARLKEYLQRDRQRSFVLTDPPLMRLVLFRIEEACYRFVWSFYSALLDTQSLNSVLKELFILYDAFCRGQIPQTDTPRPYRDYIEWLCRQDLSEAEAFWRQSLRGFTAQTPLMTDGGGYSGKTADVQVKGHCFQQMRLSPAWTSVLRSFSKQHGIALHVLVQGAWALLLSRYSGEKDVVFGATRTCRTSVREETEMESVVGLLINTLPIRILVPPEREVMKWLKELQIQDMAMRGHEHAPLVKIQEWSDILRGESLFESLLVFEDHSLDFASCAQGRNPECELLEQSSYPLTVTVGSGEELLLRIEYDPLRFEDAAVSRMTGHLKTVLQGFVDAPEQHLSDVPLLTETERRRILMEWNDTRTDGSFDVCVHEAFEDQVQRTPEAVAIVLENEFLTYEELNRRGNQLAHHLRALKVGPEVRVGICVERSFEMIVGLLGILKAGGAYVPMDPAYPQERLAFMLEDAQVPVLLTQQHLSGSLPQCGSHIICLDSQWEVIARESQKNLNGNAVAENLAYVIYTSGSTGRPKGVQIAHRGVLNLIRTTTPVFRFDESDVWTVFHSFAFDFSVWEIWTPLLCGARLIIVPLEVAQSPSDFYDLMCKEGVTVLNQTPSAIRRLTDANKVERSPSGKKLQLRLVICGGEGMPWELARRLLEWDIPLWNFYGPTEATVWASLHKIEPSAVPGGMVPIGHPLANTQLYVLDSRSEPVPVGVPGELHIGGIGLARGYFRRPELTAEKFIPNPFHPDLNTRLYKTGDLARYLPDGSIEFLGRMDHQVKIRGFRVELGEIEALLSQHPAVQESVVVVREDIPDDKRLVAYLVTRDSLLPDDLHPFLRSRLPEYMVPSFFVPLKSLPLTPNRKIDRRALPAPDSTRTEATQTYVAPRNPIEELLAGIWAEVLRIEHVGIEDDFFKIGGHSLLATQLMSRVRKAFHVDLPLKYLFEARTIAGLSTVLVKHEAIPGQVTTTARLRLKISKMSEDEVRELLREKQQARSGSNG